MVVVVVLGAKERSYIGIGVKRQHHSSHTYGGVAWFGGGAGLGGARLVQFSTHSRQEVLEYCVRHQGSQMGMGTALSYCSFPPTVPGAFFSQEPGCVIPWTGGIPRLKLFNTVRGLIKNTPYRAGIRFHNFIVQKEARDA